VPTIEVAKLNDLIDLWGTYSLRLTGTLATNYGLGDPSAATAFGCYETIGLIDDAIQDIAADDLEPVAAIIDEYFALKEQTNGPRVAASLLASMLSSIQRHVASAGLSGVTSLDLFLEYYNTGAGGTWTALQDPAFRDLYIAWTGNVAGPKPWNVYKEILEGATYANGVGKGLITGAGACSFTAGESIDECYYAGGFPKLKYASVTGTGLVTVTGSAFNPATKARVDGVTWTYSIADAAGTATLAVGTAPANSLILERPLLPV
jgi:hypothetical protein